MLRQLAKRAAVRAATANVASSSAGPSTSVASLVHAARSAEASSSSSSSSAFSTTSIKGKELQTSRGTSLSSSAPPAKNAQVQAQVDESAQTKEPTSDLLRVSTLPNGVRVATDGTPGHFVAAGVYVGTGSRFEWEGNSGSSHLIDRMAFKSTTSRTAEQMTNEIEALGGQFLASSSREVIMYQASSYTHSLSSVMSLLSDTVLHAKMTAEELEQQRQSAMWELADIHSKPEMILPELIYEVAFHNNTLGNPLLIRQDRLPSIEVETVKDFRRTWFRPDRIVVAGAGVQHEQLVELANKYFSQLEATSPRSSSSSHANRNIPTHLLQSNAASPAGRLRGTAPYATAAASSTSPLAPSFDDLANARPVYTGGAVYDTERQDLEFSHLYVGYEGLSVHDPDIYALATLQMLLGGGSSFSAGGPGKGMFSRLYTNLLNRYHDVEHCSAFHHCYSDTGLFAMCISVNPHFISRAPFLIAEQLDSLMHAPESRKGVHAVELSRAKNQLKSSLVMALESRMVQVEDLGRQVLSHGHKNPVEEMLAKIDLVTLQDLGRVARRIFRPHSESHTLMPGEVRSGEPTILAAGKLDGIPDVREVLRDYGLAP